MNTPPDQVANVIHVDFANLCGQRQVDVLHAAGPAEAEVTDAVAIFEAARLGEDCRNITTHYLTLLDQKRPHSIGSVPTDEFTTDPPPATIGELELRIEETYDAMASVTSIDVARALLNVLREQGPAAELTGARLLGSFAASGNFSPGELLKNASHYAGCDEPVAKRNVRVIATGYLRSRSISRSPDGRIIGKNEVERQRALRKLRAWDLR